MRDNGIGIARTEHRRIFEKFYRVDERLSRAVEGSGLGLAIVRHVVRAQVKYGVDVIKILAVEGDPPDVYRLEYLVRSLAPGEDADDEPTPRDVHQVEIRLTADYPRVSPKCKMLTPVYHPNIDPSHICVGDHWVTGERLVDLVIRIGEMIAYQAYNIKSPLDAHAAMWADLNVEKLPTDPRTIRPAEME